MKTIIRSNGSKFAGQKNDTIEELLEVLKEHDLDLRGFAVSGFLSFTDSNGYSNSQYEEHNVRVWGNFTGLSHVFDIEGKYRILRPLIEAIQENINSQCDRISKR